MQFLFERIDTLPRLAWCARVDLGVPFVRVLHGRDLEVGTEFFCEGAWSGNFAAADFENTLLVGSGGKITERGLLIAAPNHTMERIYALKQAETLLISNSCAFVFAQAQDEPDPNYLLYGPKLASIIYGLEAYARCIPTRNRNRIRMFCHCNLNVGIGHQLTETPKRPVREFTDFADYQSFLEEQVRAITANANAPERRVRYRPIATVSSGYDSAASAVFARKVGCDEAVTFRSARPKGAAPGLDDSGAAIAERLGMRVTVYDRFAYLNQTGFPEAEGGISEFSALAEPLERRVLFTGFHGGGVWSLSREAVGPLVRRNDIGGNSLSEFRLRVGFVHLPVPYLGCTSHASIHRISVSKEMEPWLTGTAYDRPIPRRLVEEAGVHRTMFGTEKKAVAIVAREEGFDRTMTRESFADFSRFVEEHRTVQLSATLRLCRLAHYLAGLNRVLNRIVLLISRRLGKPIWLRPVVPPGVEWVGRLGKYSLLFHWSIRKLMARYQVAHWDSAGPPGRREQRCAKLG